MTLLLLGMLLMLLIQLSIAKTSTTNVDTYAGVIITLTGAGNAQTSNTNWYCYTKVFSVTNSSTFASAIDVNGTSLVAGKHCLISGTGLHGQLLVVQQVLLPLSLHGELVLLTLQTISSSIVGIIYRAIAPTTGNTPNVSPPFLGTPTSSSCYIYRPLINAAVSTAIVDGYDGGFNHYDYHR